MREDFSTLVNASGFLFQLGVEDVVRRSENSHGWRVISREHPWSANVSSGFIDLVIAKGSVTGAIECKRVRDGAWVFLVPNGHNSHSTLTRALWVAGIKRKAISGWDLIEELPSSHVSAFCVIRGTGESDRPLLERICSTLLYSVDALANEEVSILKKRHQGWYGYFLPIVVTNAKLFISKFETKEVNLSSGTLESQTFEEIPFIRFKKGFSTFRPPGSDPDDLTSAATAHERTVWIVHADQLSTFLRQIDRPAYADPYPWVQHIKAIESEDENVSDHSK